MILQWGGVPVEMTETDGVWQGSLAEGLSLKAWESDDRWVSVSLHAMEKGKPIAVWSGPWSEQYLADAMHAALEARDKRRQERLDVLDGIMGRLSTEMKAQRARAKVIGTHE